MKRVSFEILSVINPGSIKYLTLFTMIENPVFTFNEHLKILEYFHVVVTV